MPCFSSSSGLAVKRGSGVSSASSSLSSTLAWASRWRRRSASRTTLAVLVVGVAELRDGDVRLDSAGLNRAARRRVVARRGQPERAVGAGLHDGLDRALAEALLAHDQRAAVILERAGDDFGRRSGAGIGQHDHRKAVRHVAGTGIIALDIVLGRGRAARRSRRCRGSRRRRRRPGRAGRRGSSAGRRHSRAGGRRSPCRSQPAPPWSARRRCR